MIVLSWSDRNETKRVSRRSLLEGHVIIIEITAFDDESDWWRWNSYGSFVEGIFLRWLKNGCSVHGMECLLDAIQITLWYWWETFSPHGIVMFVLCDTDYVADGPWCCSWRCLCDEYSRQTEWKDMTRMTMTKRHLRVELVGLVWESLSMNREVEQCTKNHKSNERWKYIASDGVENTDHDII